MLATSYLYPPSTVFLGFINNACMYTRVTLIFYQDHFQMLWRTQVWAVCRDKDGVTLLRKILAVFHLLSMTYLQDSCFWKIQNSFLADNRLDSNKQ